MYVYIVNILYNLKLLFFLHSIDLDSLPVESSISPIVFIFCPN